MVSAGVASVEGASEDEEEDAEEGGDEEDDEEEEEEEDDEEEEEEEEDMDWAGAGDAERELPAEESESSSAQNKN